MAYCLRTVVIKNAVREGGERAKVAVASNDTSVDPVGACVGMKGSRINAVIREMRGEKIDIIQFSDDIVDYTTNALNPARIARVLIADPVNKVLEVVVPEDHLSLAIGKKGQNVRLASRLLGWEINIVSEEEKKIEIMEQMDQMSAPAVSLSELQGVGAKTQSRMAEAGIESIQELLSKSVEELTSIPGIGLKTAEKLVAAARAATPAETEKEAEIEQTEDLADKVDEQSSPDEPSTDLEPEPEPEKVKTEAEE